MERGTGWTFIGVAIVIAVSAFADTNSAAVLRTLLMSLVAAGVGAFFLQRGSRAIPIPIRIRIAIAVLLLVLMLASRLVGS